LTLNGSVLLERNSAAVSGGALAVYDSPRIEVRGKVTFVDNHVDISYNGGTNFLIRDANVLKVDMHKRDISNVTVELVSRFFTYSGSPV